MTHPLLRTVVLSLSLLLPAGCGMLGFGTKPAEPVAVEKTSNASATAAPAVPRIDRPELLTAIDLSAVPTVATSPVQLLAGRSEWVSVVLRVRTPAAGQKASLVVPTWKQSATTLKAKPVRLYQILPMPLDVNRAGYVRQTGQTVTAESLPRALLPVDIRDGRLDLTKLRDPNRPAEPAAVATDMDVLLWADLRVGIDAGPGHYEGAFVYQIDVAADKPAEIKATVPVNIDVADFVLPDDRHLNMVADVPWERLRRLWPEHFEAVRPQLLNRTDPDSRGAVGVLDSLVTLAQEHRVQVHIPRLQPVVKWPANKPVAVDWTDYDALVGPWLNGMAFPDRVPLGFWALPRIDYLSNVRGELQLQYYTAAAAHFDQRDWLRLSPVILAKDTPGRATVEERLLLSAEASRVLNSHPRVRVRVPLEPAEVQLAGNNNANLIDPTATGRLNTVAPGLISESAMRQWPSTLDKPRNWLRTDLSGLIPYTGAGGDESDVRVWAFAAFLRQAESIQWDACLPAERNPQTPADPNQLVWFYPGNWFGVDQPVPTIQLKWLRRAQQDFEYLRLAEQRGSRTAIYPIARLLAKPVEIQPGQNPDPTYGLLIGTASARAWAELKPILVQILQSRGPGIEPNENLIADLNQTTLRWMEPLERPVILPRRTDWNVGTPPSGETGTWVNLRLGFDLYNASDTKPVQNDLSYDPARLPAGWVVTPQPVRIPTLLMYQVAPQGINARIDPARVDIAKHPPVRIEFRSGYTGASTPLDVVAPVTRSVRRRAPLLINGSLDDWMSDDGLQGGPLVKMLNRPAVQAHALEYASTRTELFSAWADDDFYLAFRVEGLSASKAVLASRNFVDYQIGRAWSEDVCQAVFQGVYDDGTNGPQVHVAVKPGGNVWIERRDKPGDAWAPFESGVRYAATVQQAIWRGEIAIPWQALIQPAKTDLFATQGKPNLPTLVKFNFIQHKRDTGESASWAGPIDGGRDDPFTGVIVLKEPE